jgi:hypothetical protein
MIKIRIIVLQVKQFLLNNRHGEKLSSDVIGTKEVLNADIFFAQSLADLALLNSVPSNGD